MIHHAYEQKMHLLLRSEQKGRINGGNVSAGGIDWHLAQRKNMECAQIRVNTACIPTPK
jgi:hypothetical protein